MAGKTEDISDAKDVEDRKTEDISDVEDRKNEDSSGKKIFRIEDFSVVVEGGQIGDPYYGPIVKKEDLPCGERSTLVFWNMNQCPIPTDVLPSVRPTIRSVLNGMGLHGSLRIYAYGNKSLLDHKDIDVFNEALICYCVEREQLPDADIEDELKNAGIGDPNEIHLDVLMSTEQTCDLRAILMVIPKPDKNSELHRVLKCLHSRDHDVLLVDPPVGDSGGQFLKSAESLVGVIQGLHGERDPITKPRCGCSYSC